MKKPFKRQSSHLVKGRSGEHKSKVIVHFYDSFRAGRYYSFRINLKNISNLYDL